MSRYINYDAIDYRNDKMHDKSSDFIDGVIYMAQRIENAPSIDIVFCKECKYSRNAYPFICQLGKALAIIESGDCFCSYGERRE